MGESLKLGYEGEADGGRGGDVGVGAGEAAGGGIDAEGGDVIGILMSGEEPAAVGGEGEVARLGAAARDDLDDREAFDGRIEGEDGEIIGPAVGGVEEAAVGVDADGGGFVFAAEIGGEGGDGVERMERAGVGFVAERGEGAAHFGKHEHVTAVGGEGEVARAGAGFDGDEGGLGGGEGGGGGIEAVGEDFVDAEIADEDVAVVGRKDDAMRMRGGLAVGVDARTGVLDAFGGDAGKAGVGERDGGDVSRMVMRDERDAGGSVDGDVGGRFGDGGLGFAERGERAAVGGEGEAGDEGGGVADGVETLAVGREREVGGVGGFGGERGRGNGAGVGIELGGVDAAAAADGVGADEERDGGHERNEWRDGAGWQWKGSGGGGGSRRQGCFDRGLARREERGNFRTVCANCCGVGSARVCESKLRCSTPLP